MTTYRIALAGNPNTGKSTLFNTLTGLKQHTGNWTGKTVVKTTGEFTFQGHHYEIVDLPGTYSLFSNSTDEEVARDYIIFDQPDVTVVVMDATALERNMNLALQVLEMTDKVVICINLADEAKKNGIFIDDRKLSQRLGVPVVQISARNRSGLVSLLQRIEEVAGGKVTLRPHRIQYSQDIEQRIQSLLPQIEEIVGRSFPARWLALRLLDGDDRLLHSLEQRANGTWQPAIKEAAPHAAC